MITVPEQLSVAIISSRSIGGISEAQARVTSNDQAGIRITGATLSFTVMV